ncbi:MAG: sigma-70 family RNA polymerase sigma factor [Chloroflexi bacterium]|nr:MAG: sigma-70 family RNA polymerase sigma factor [Chloroflexota bacterium]
MGKPRASDQAIRVQYDRGQCRVATRSRKARLRADRRDRRRRDHLRARPLATLRRRSRSRPAGAAARSRVDRSAPRGCPAAPARCPPCARRHARVREALLYPSFKAAHVACHLTSARASPFYRREIGPVTFGDLLERHEREIFAYALRLTGNRADADDIFQETFLAAFRAWPPPRSGNERAWLYRIATNKCVDRARKTKRLVPLADLRLAAPERDGVTIADLAAAVRTLPPGQRAAFVLRKVEGRAYGEIAAVLECSEDAARSRVAEAMKKLKEAIR